jgi:hypothetical protein
MAAIVQEFEYEKALWRGKCQTATGCPLDVLVVGDAKLFESQLPRDQLLMILESIDRQIDDASAFAWASEYRIDIGSADQMTVKGIVISLFEDVRIWFDLRGSGRMLAVKMQNGRSVDVYCEH